MLLALDVGNSNIFAGLFDNDSLVSTFRLSANKNTDSKQLKALITNAFAKEGIKADTGLQLAVSSVVPQIKFSLKKVLTEDFGTEPFFVEFPLKTSLSYLIDNPSELGADRLVNSEAAYDKYKKNLIVIDFGTATTFDCITLRGEYIGGLIVPGLRISADALIAKTARLPEVPLEKPSNLIGKNTIECIQSGLMNGYFSMTDGIIKKLKKEMEGDLHVISTGGLANAIIHNCYYIDEVDTELTLKGIKKVYELNK